MGETARIHIVDDDENIRKVLTAILEEEGYTVESVDIARKAIEITRKKSYNARYSNSHNNDYNKS